MSRKKVLFKVASEILDKKFTFTKDSGDDYWGTVDNIVNEHINTNEDFEKIIEKFLNKTKVKEVKPVLKILEVEALLEELKLDEPKNLEEVQETTEVVEKKERKNKRKNNE